MSLVIIFLPLFISVYLLLFGRFLNYDLARIMTFIVSLFCFVCSIEVFFSGVVENFTLVVVFPFEWIKVGGLLVDWCFVFDSLSSVMISVVFFISFVVQFYSYEYMRYDPHFLRYISYINLFTFFMVFLLTSGNFLQMFFGWEGVGLCSYLLVNFWYTRVQANKSAFKAMIVNRVGDWFFAVGIGFIFLTFGSLDCFFVNSVISEVFLMNSKLTILSWEFSFIDVTAFFLVFGVFAKSAQFGLHIWLPDAMEGPTPVSALLHAATMVTAGVFLVIRCSFIFEYAPFVMFLISFLGAITAISASTVACFQVDLKKIIAYSTCSQLGYMLFACGLSLYSTALFHFFNHAFFKALLFLGAGAIIHSVYGEQDSEVIEGLEELLPFTAQVFSIACLVLASYPFLGAFYSKDWILEVMYASYYVDGVFMFNLVLHAAVYTAIYANDLISVFEDSDDEGGFSDSVFSGVAESGFNILASLFMLVIISMLSGFFFKDLFIGVGSSSFHDSIFVLLSNQTFYETEYLPVGWKLLPLIASLSVSFILSSWLEDELIESFFRWDFFSFSYAYKVMVFISDFFELYWLYNSFVGVWCVYKFGIFCNMVVFKSTDKGIFEVFGPDGIEAAFKNLFGVNLVYYVSGYIFHYSFFFIFGLVTLLLIVFYVSFIVSLELFFFIFFLSFVCVFLKFFE